MERYYRQFDGLRAFAVILVVASHVFPERPWWFFPMGTFGVQLFFGLSGFLITNILLGMKESREQGESLGFLLKQFYIRRALRIFPLYYAVLALGVVASTRGLPYYDEYMADLPWFALYGSNWLTFIENRWLGHVSHFWSLAIEEQFYMAWPLAILLAPRRFLAPLFGALIGFSVLSRLGLATMGLDHRQVQVATFCNLDALVGGAWFAMLVKAGRNTDATRWCGRVGIIGLVLMVISRFYSMGRGTNSTGVVLELTEVAGCAFLGLCLLERASRGFGGLLGKVLECSPLVYIGRVSYGVYIFHNLVLRYTERRLAGTVSQLNEMMWGLGHVAMFAFCLAATVAISALSWHLFEGPINGLKKHFPYRRRESATPSSA